MDMMIVKVFLTFLEQNNIFLEFSLTLLTKSLHESSCKDLVRNVRGKQLGKLFCSKKVSDHHIHKDILVTV